VVDKRIPTLEVAESIPVAGSHQDEGVTGGGYGATPEPLAASRSANR
jgi:hypothetical protein